MDKIATTLNFNMASLAVPSAYRSVSNKTTYKLITPTRLLTLHLPKVEQAANQKVKINFGDQSQQAIVGSSGQS